MSSLAGRRTRVRSLRRGRAVSTALVAVLIVAAGCGDGLSQQQLQWCAENQTKVARTAMRLLLLQPGTDYVTWKASDPNGYDRACRDAYAAG